MGAGTGPLTPQQRFKVTVQFDPNIAPGHEVYKRFKDAVRGLLGKARWVDWVESIAAQKVVEAKIIMCGPIETDDDAREFNRAFNRILWGVRVVRPGDVNGQIALSGFKAHVREIQSGEQDPTAPNWLHESLVTGVKGKAAKGKAGQGERRGKAAARKPRTRY